MDTLPILENVTRVITILKKSWKELSSLQILGQRPSRSRFGPGRFWF